MLKITEKIIHYILGILLLLLAINAFAGGYFGMAGAPGIPTEWLNGSPFRNYFIPGLMLFAAVGGSALLAAILVFRRHPIARTAAFGCGVIVLAWLTAQIVIIGYVSWMQPTTAAMAIFILLLTSIIQKHEH